MARSTTKNSKQPKGEVFALSMPKAMKLLSRQERFMATVAAMNTLLIEKRIYTPEEFDTIFCQWAAVQVVKRKKQRRR